MKLIATGDMDLGEKDKEELHGKKSLRKQGWVAQKCHGTCLTWKRGQSLRKGGPKKKYIETDKGRGCLRGGEKCLGTWLQEPSPRNSSRTTKKGEGKESLMKMGRKKGENKQNHEKPLEGRVDGATQALAGQG